MALKPKIKTAIRVEIRDRQGRLIQVIEKESRSYVQQMIDILYVQRALAGLSIRDTSNTLRSIVQNANNLSVPAPAANDAYGIHVGTGSAAVALSNYALQTKIAHGSGAGQLQYGATSVGAPATVGSTRRMTIARTFTNVSGAAITVNEVGLVCVAWTTTTSYTFLVDRSLLTFTVANGASATVTYTESVTV